MEFDYRIPTNRPGVVYDETKFDRLFAEDMQGVYDALTILYAFGDYIFSAVLEHPQNFPPSGSYQKVKLDSVEFDPTEMWDFVAFKMITPISGVYKFDCNLGIVFPSPALLPAQIALYKNGTLVKESIQTIQPPRASLQISAMISLHHTDIVELYILNPMAPSCNIAINSKENWLTCQLVQEG